MIKAKKSLGQNFLTDRNILELIVDSVSIKNKTILEVGPGTGNLTSFILKNNPKKLFVIEKDNDLAKNLYEKFKDQLIGNLIVMGGLTTLLTVGLGKLLGQGRTFGELTRVKSEFINKITLRLCQYPSMHFFLPAQTKAEKTKVHIPKADTNRTVKYQITAHHGIACPIERKKVYMQHYQMMRPDIFQKKSLPSLSWPSGFCDRSMSIVPASA